MRPGTKQTQMHTSELPHPHLSSWALLHKKVPPGGLLQSLPCLFKCNFMVTPDPPGTRLVLYTHSYSHIISLCYLLLYLFPLPDTENDDTEGRRMVMSGHRAAWGGGCHCSLPQGGCFHHPGTLRTQEGLQKPIQDALGPRSHSSLGSGW